MNPHDDKQHEDARDKAKADFVAWFVNQYPANCILHKPVWHAPKIFRAVEAFLDDHAQRPLLASAPSHEPRNLCTASYPHQPHGSCDGDPFASAASTTPRKSDRLLGRMIQAWFGKELPDDPAPTRDTHEKEFFERMGRVYDVMQRASEGTTASATERNAVIEECAAIADYLYENGADTDGSVLLVDCSNKIRDLKNRADGRKQT